MFDHVQTAMEHADGSRLLDSPHSTMETGAAPNGDSPRGSKSPRGHAATIAALKLLDDLCMMATGLLLLHLHSQFDLTMG